MEEKELDCNLSADSNDIDNVKRDTKIEQQNNDTNTAELQNSPENQVFTVRSQEDMPSDVTIFSELINDRLDVTEEEALLLQLIDPRSELPNPTPETDTHDVISRDTLMEKVVTVKFKINSGETVTSTFMVHSQIGEVKDRLANILRIHVNDISLSCNGNECDDARLMLLDLGAEPLSTIELNLQSTDPNNIIALGDLSHYIPVVDVITVRVARPSGGFKDVVVEIENHCTEKEWLGGFRHRLTKLEYHHASVQTLPRKRPTVSLPQLSRSAQTPIFPLVDVSVGSSPSKGTQVSQIDDYIPHIADRVVVTDSSRFQQETNNNVLQVVSIAEKVHKNFKQNVIRRKEQRERDKELWEEDFSPDNKKTNRAVFPLKRSDFYLLYSLVGKWWRKEMGRIAMTKKDESRAAALLSLLQREVALLSAIEQQRIQARKVNWVRRNVRFLEMTARPVIFRNARGATTFVDTLETQQAREYQEIITSFMNTDVTKQQRLDVIKTIKIMFKEKTCYEHYEFTNEIINLLDRETQLLMLGMSNNQLTGLRERVLQLLIDLFNRFVNDTNKSINVPHKAGAKNQPLHSCVHCNRLKPASDYNVHVNMKSFQTCRSCEWIKNIGNQRIDLSPYSRLLSQVRQSEMQNCSYTSVCYVIQVVGMYYLVHDIWCCKSILSDNNNTDELRMVRFRRKEDWSPWNCILLTVEESKSHLSIPDINRFYSQPFLEKIQWKHQRAKNHFFPLLLNDKSIRDSKVWFNMKDTSTSTVTLND